MITELKTNVEKALLKCGMVNKIIAIVDESDIDKMINIPDLPTAGYTIEPKKITAGGVTVLELSILISDLSSNDIDDLYMAKDKAVKIASYVFREISELETCVIDVAQVRDTDLSSISVMTTVKYTCAL